jgi:hypothetical protein
MMSRKTFETKLAALEEAIWQQRLWIKNHGGNRSGYLVKYGENGPGIYDADIARLHSLQSALPTEDPYGEGR